MEADKKLIPLTSLPQGELATVWEFVGGREMVRRLEAMGVRKGKHIKKISGQLMRGPITVQVEHTKISIGYGMASKIMVDLPAGRQG
jgi:ferrous iron transport protein A